jgi:hypothetical protein
MSHPEEITHWAHRMDVAQTRDEFLDAWDRWADAVGIPRGEEPTPDRKAEQLLTGQEP